jgi:uncharacterized protein (DUF885 family)
MGELTIRGLRKKAETALGPRFDIREFHDQVLAGGTVTLPILERRIEEWIGRKEAPLTLPSPPHRGEGD